MMYAKLNSKHPLFNCGRKDCIICMKAFSILKAKKIIKKDFQSSAVAPFVSRFNYPDINVGILVPPEHVKEAWIYDAPRFWSAQNYQIPEIIDFRSFMVNSSFKTNIKQKTKILQITQEAAMSSFPADVEVNLLKKPNFNFNLDRVSAPIGANAKLKNVKIVSNTKISNQVNKAVGDNDLKTNDAIVYLYKNRLDENSITRLLSIGLLGLGKNRKLVPTRWSIVSVDSNIGNYLVSKIKDYPQSPYLAFYGGYLGNYYLIMFFSEAYAYELFETHISDIDSFMTDYEPYGGRTSYVEQTAGGFYACRIAVLEKLEQIKKQASVLALRFVTNDYTLPLGVFVCREAARKSLDNKPIEFSSKELMLIYAKKLIKKRFNLDIEILLKESLLLKNLKHQLKISRFL